LRICLLTTQDLDEDPFPDDDWPCDPRPFVPEATWHLEVLEGKDCTDHVEGLVAENFDVYFNLCDGAADQDIPGIEVVQTLERHQVPFTGATSVYYEPSRQLMKEACHRQGLFCPAHQFAYNLEDIERAAWTMEFPLFVKHPSSYASVDLTPASRVRNPAELKKQARRMLKKHGGALIEQYIAGTECTVLVAENPLDPMQPKTYQPMQYRFPEGEEFKHEELKWVDYDELSCFPVTDPLLASRLRDISARFFVELQGASFGRCDVRVDEQGRPFILEINPNCGVFYPPTDPGSADLILMNDAEGHEGFARRLISAALCRHAASLDEQVG